MNDDDIVADASAIIALLVGEPITRFDPTRLAGASISAVNLSEVLARLQEFGTPESEAVAAVARLELRIVPFDEPLARAAARLRSLTRHVGLSLGDRACLALGEKLGYPVITADRVWGSLEIGVAVVVIR
ncbi:MAG TPA: type II toxin-antitoxin system VapC family toxin [Stellaceae bacterium]|nr:type II toxin-antitoxin system VapC family toxin [Stellaceae bacterium]